MSSQLPDRESSAGYIQGFGPRIEGRLRKEASGGVHRHVNPSTGEVQADLVLAGPAEVEEAVRVARKMAPVWRAVPANEKVKILNRWVDLLDAHGDELALITARECGTPARLGQGSGFAGLWIRYFAGWCDKIEGQVVHSTLFPGFNYVLSEPYGVIAAVLTWNGPVPSLGMKVAPALAAGNSVVVKTAEFASFGALRACELAEEAGLPPGVLNVLPGGPSVGAALVGHRDVDKISFTGGGATAKRVMAAAADTLRPMALELGGKSANIIFSDARLDTVLPSSLLGSIVVASGQGCVNPTRVLVHKSRYEEVLAGMTEIVKKLRIGNALDAGVDVGPVIGEAACNRIQGVIAQARESKSGKLVIGGERCGSDLARGFFIAPTIFGDVDHASDLAQEEIFGPVLALTRFDDDEEAVAMANDNRYGLGAYLHTQDIERAHRAARDLRVGCVYVNSGYPNLTPTAPFGGTRDSGFGREGGRAGLEEFLHPKSVFIAMSR
jgi:aldehyde dehydrogenase (NAD+)